MTMSPARVGLDNARIFGMTVEPDTTLSISRLRSTEAFDSIEHPLRIVQRGPPFNCIRHETTSPCDIPFVKRLDALVKDCFRFALPFRLRAACALDVCAGSTVMPVEEQHPRPQVDRLLVLRSEVLIETGEQQLLDSRVPFGAAQRLGGSGFGTKRIVG